MKMRTDRRAALVALAIVVAAACAFLVGLDAGRNHTPRVPAYVTCSAEPVLGAVKCPPGHSRPVLATWYVQPDHEVNIVALYSDLEWLLFTDPERPVGSFGRTTRPPDTWVELNRVELEGNP